MEITSFCDTKKPTLPSLAFNYLRNTCLKCSGITHVLSGLSKFPTCGPSASIMRCPSLQGSRAALETPLTEGGPIASAWTVAQCDPHVGRAFVTSDTCIVSVMLWGSGGQVG